MKQKFFLFVCMFLILAETKGSDVGPVTPESLAQAVKGAFSGDDSWWAKNSEAVKKLSESADSLFIAQLEKELGHLDRECEEACISQDRLLKLLSLPPSPERLKAILIAWPQLIKELCDVRSRASSLSGRLRGYYKVYHEKEPFNKISAFAGRASHFAMLQQGMFEAFVKKNVNQVELGH